MYTILLFMTFLVAYTPHVNSCSTFVINDKFLCEIGKIRTPIERINITALFENMQFINQTESIQENNYNTKDGNNIIIMSGLSALGGILFICSVYYVHRYRRNNYKLKQMHKKRVDDYLENPLYQV